MESRRESLDELLNKGNDSLMRIKVNPAEVLNVGIIKRTGWKISKFPVILLVREDNVFKAYFNDPERTERDMKENNTSFEDILGLRLSEDMRIGKVLTYRPLGDQVDMERYNMILLKRGEPDIPYEMDAYHIN